MANGHVQMLNQSCPCILLANHAGVCMGNGMYSFHFVYSPEGVGHYFELFASDTWDTILPV